MRHGDKINNLSRTASHRKAMLKNMACSLIQHKSINTTTAKAKALRKFVEPLITKSKNDTQHNRRVVFSYLQDKQATKELFTSVADKVGDRPGGYTRILKIGIRSGDNADMAMIELIDFNEFYTPRTKKSDSKKKRSRRGGTGKGTEKKAETAPVVEDAVEVVEATPEAVVEAIADTPEAEVVETVAETEVPVVEESSEETPEAQSTDESSDEEKKA
jgi:large subunit ribosomal protein L17